MKKIVLLFVVGSFTILAAGIAIAQAHDQKTDRFTDVDTNQDGALTLEELSAHAATRTQRMFKEADQNKDGVLSSDELRSWRQAKRGQGGRKGRKRSNRRLDREKAADSNQDGVIDKQEFLAAAERRFDRRDRNGDGILSEADRPSKSPGQ